MITLSINDFKRVTGEPPCTEAYASLAASWLLHDADTQIPMRVWWAAWSWDVRARVLMLTVAHPREAAHRVLRKAALQGTLREDNTRCVTTRALLYAEDPTRVLAVLREWAANSTDRTASARECRAQIRDLEECLREADEAAAPAPTPPADAADVNAEQRILWARQQVHTVRNRVYVHKTKPDVRVLGVSVGLVEADLSAVVIYNHAGTIFTRPYAEFFARFEEGA